MAEKSAVPRAMSVIATIVAVWWQMPQTAVAQSGAHGDGRSHICENDGLLYCMLIRSTPKVPR